MEISNRNLYNLKFDVIIMEILISVDIEGINGIDDYNQIKETNKKRYNHSCRLMTEETNTAIEACIEGGATKIFLVDGHGDGNNLIKKELNSKAITIKKKKYLPEI